MALHFASRQHATLALAGVTALWGTIPLIVRSVDLPAAAIVGMRLWLAALGLGAVVVWERRMGRPSGPPIGSVQRVRCVAVAVVLAVHWVALFAAYQRAPIGTVIFIVYLAPIGIAAGAPLVLRERASRRTLVALGLAVFGFVLMAGRTVHGAGVAGLLLAVLAAATFVVLVLLSKPLADAYGGVRSALIEMGGAGLVLVPVVLLTVHWGAPRAAWAWLIVLGLVHTGAGIAVYLAALASVGATTTGVLGYVEPASAVLWAWLVLHETPALVTLAGGVAILAAGFLLVRVEQPTAEVLGVLG